MSSTTEQMRVLIVCYDNMSATHKASLTTAGEIVKNKDWLVKVADTLLLVAALLR